MIVDDAERATSILMQHGYLMSMTPVMVVVVPDRAGGLADVLDVLAEGNIDGVTSKEMESRAKRPAAIEVGVAERLKG